MPEAEHRQRYSYAFEQHYGAIVAYLYRRTRDFHDAQDLATNVFTVAWRRVDDLPEEPASRPWLLAIARNSLSNHWRGRDRRRRLFERLARETSSVDSQAFAEAAEDGPVIGAYRRLRRGEQEVLELIDWDGLSHEEAARVLDIKVGTFDVRLHRARAALRRELADEPAAHIEQGSRRKRGLNDRGAMDRSDG